MHNFLSSELKSINNLVYCIEAYIRVEKISWGGSSTHVDARKMKGKHFSELKAS